MAGEGNGGSSQNGGWNIRFECGSYPNGAWGFNWDVSSGPRPGGITFGFGSGGGWTRDGGGFGYRWGCSQGSGGTNWQGNFGFGGAFRSSTGQSRFNVVGSNGNNNHPLYRPPA